MTLDTELEQMLRDAQRARAGRAWPVRVWHAIAERLNITSEFRRADRGRRPSREKVMFLDDIRHALKRFRSQPGSAIACMLMLAMAIGVTTSMFAVADHMLWRPAPFADADRLRAVWQGQTMQTSRTNLAMNLAKGLRQVTVFEDVILTSYEDTSFIAEGSQGLALKGVQRISTNVFAALGARPLLGRTFASDEQGSDDVVMISEKTWRTDFSADPEIIGRHFRASGRLVKVIGVMPKTFRFPSDSTSVWRPLDVDHAPATARASVFVKMARGIPEDDVRRAAVEATRNLVPDPAKHGFILRRVGAYFLDDYTKVALRILMAGVSLVFLVLCANVTNLILARTAARRTEFGVCTALGAARSRLITQVLIENAMIGFAAAAVGLLLAWAMLEGAVRVLPESFLWRTLNPIALDWRATLVTAGLAIAAIILAGLPPAWIGTRVNAADSIRLESRGSSESRTSRRWAQTLLILEVSLASTLLVGAGVLVTSFVRLTNTDPGIDVRNVTTVQLSLPAFVFKDKDARIAMGASIREQLASMPRVTLVSQSFGLPPTGGGFTDNRFIIDGVPATAEGTMTFNTNVSPEFFDVFGIQILEGRKFTADDTEHIAIISSGMAASLFPGRTALGHTLAFSATGSPYTIVGVAREVRSTLEDPRDDSPEFYLPLSGTGGVSLYLGVKCDGACPTEGEIRARVRAVSANAMVTKVQSMGDAYFAQFERPRLAAQLAVGFSVIALVAAAGGLFSILTYAVSRRRREFGIRSAMGAAPGQLRSMIIRDGLVTACVGLVFGGVLSFLASAAVESLLFGVTLTSPLVWAAVASVIVLSTLLASWRPAVQATKADPLELLREN